MAWDALQDYLDVQTTDCEAAGQFEQPLVEIGASFVYLQHT
ncbi:hypothetical protein BN2537_17101 [Streptomyces venezuelae]|nr:hypothetical protein BN2537_17101 [Streptomyces venezuelae]